jgi:hypothetical protein
MFQVRSLMGSERNLKSLCPLPARDGRDLWLLVVHSAVPSTYNRA